MDGAVRRPETAYYSQGNAYLFSRYDAASGGTVANHVERQFNDLGQLMAEHQAHGGPIDTDTPAVGALAANPLVNRP